MNLMIFKKWKTLLKKQTNPNGIQIVEQNFGSPTKLKTRK